MKLITTAAQAKDAIIEIAVAMNGASDKTIATAIHALVDECARAGCYQLFNSNGLVQRTCLFFTTGDSIVVKRFCVTGNIQFVLKTKQGFVLKTRDVTALVSFLKEVDAK